MILTKRLYVLILGVFIILGTSISGKAAVNLRNPWTTPIDDMASGQNAHYDSLYFGMYPQTEIVDRESRCGTYGEDFSRVSDYIVNEELYEELSGLSGWDSNGDITYGGEKYRRIRYSDALHSTMDCCYNWDDENTYHYFKYERIKWRVLQVNEDYTLLLSDKILDNRKYDDYTGNSNWGSSTIRSFLNGYSSSHNRYGKDYSKNNFKDTAFTVSEQSALKETLLDNSGTGEYSGSFGGYDTRDKIFFLSAYDVYNSDIATSYGFNRDSYLIADEARRAYSSTFAKAMGNRTAPEPIFSGYGMWWLRSPGSAANQAAIINPSGTINPIGYVTSCVTVCGVRPAICLDTRNSSDWTYAGVLESLVIQKEECTLTYDVDGGDDAPDNIVAPEGTKITITNLIPTRAGYEFLGWSTKKNATSVDYRSGVMYTLNTNITLYAVWKQYGKATQKIMANNKMVALKGSVKLAALSNGNGNMTYKSSSTAIATVSKSGLLTGKKYGIATVTITAAETDDYKATTKKIKVYVVPKKMSFKSVKSTSKHRLTLEWKKDSSVSGYQVYVSKLSDFSDATLTNFFTRSVSKANVYHLESKKTFYVKIRAYRTISGKRYYGAWSKVVKVKVK